ncbi:hypothetical protein BDY17DRAFT_301885 [Neohortaea acidophila]|uniref:Uncharacterized protein n=1 Tax=Neohortaea acidophila TaxID=245834 RepID=A0A6A6PKG8_9PEZI|nr:uncharacterized protein BDY17DRAFT_301885 [Neohortaea acidophila]KAF2480502.1 hypothetical protein BDY17DRAFT_301885 [Neohortaea acidophila]
MEVLPVVVVLPAHCLCAAANALRQPSVQGLARRRHRLADLALLPVGRAASSPSSRSRRVGRCRGSESLDAERGGR